MSISFNDIEKKFLDIFSEFIININENLDNIISHVETNKKYYHDDDNNFNNEWSFTQTFKTRYGQLKNIYNKNDIVYDIYINIKNPKAITIEFLINDINKIFELDNANINKELKKYLNNIIRLYNDLYRKHPLHIIKILLIQKNLIDVNKYINNKIIVIKKEKKSLTEQLEIITKTKEDIDEKSKELKKKYKDKSGKIDIYIEKQIKQIEKYYNKCLKDIEKKIYENEINIQQTDEEISAIRNIHRLREFKKKKDEYEKINIGLINEKKRYKKICEETNTNVINFINNQKENIENKFNEISNTNDTSTTLETYIKKLNLLNGINLDNIINYLKKFTDIFAIVYYVISYQCLYNNKNNDKNGMINLFNNRFNEFIKKSNFNEVKYTDDYFTSLISLIDIFIGDNEYSNLELVYKEQQQQKPIQKQQQKQQQQQQKQKQKVKDEIKIYNKNYEVYTKLLNECHKLISKNKLQLFESQLKYNYNYFQDIEKKLKEYNIDLTSARLEELYNKYNEAVNIEKDDLNSKFNNTIEYINYYLIKLRKFKNNLDKEILRKINEDSGNIKIDETNEEIINEEIIEQKIIDYKIKYLEYNTIFEECKKLRNIKKYEKKYDVFVEKKKFFDKKNKEINKVKLNNISYDLIFNIIDDYGKKINLLDYINEYIERIKKFKIELDTDYKAFLKTLIYIKSDEKVDEKVEQQENIDNKIEVILEPFKELKKIYDSEEDLEELDPDYNIRSVLNIKNIILIPPERAKTITLSLLNGLTNTLYDEYNDIGYGRTNIMDELLNKIKYKNNIIDNYNKSLNTLADIIYTLLKIKNNADNSI
jgi:hypothetical protein